MENNNLPTEQQEEMEDNLLQTIMMLISWYSDMSDSKHLVNPRVFEYNDMCLQVALLGVQSKYQQLRPGDVTIFKERPYVTKALDDPLKAMDCINMSLEYAERKIDELQKPEFAGFQQYDFIKYLLITFDCLHELRENKSITPLIDISNIEFEPSYFIRYNNSIQVEGPNRSRRAIKIESNIEGLGGYTVTIFNLDGINPQWGDNIQMAPKQMAVIVANDSHTILRGWGVDPRAMNDPGGLFSNYGISIYHSYSQITKIVSHMHDRGIDIEYVK